MDTANKRPSTGARVLIFGLIGCSLVFFIGIIALSLWAARQDQIQEGTILELSLDGPLSEGPSTDPLAALFGGGSASLFDLRQGLRAAAKDDKIVGVLLRVQMPQLGLAQATEIVEELERFKQSEKPVHVLLQTDMVSDAQLYLASAGTKVWTTPAAFWLVDGLRADVMFWKGTLDKLHIEPDFIMFKEYKSAGEPMSRTEMSEYMREALTGVLTDIQSRWLDGVSQRRNIERDRLQAFVDQGIQTGAAAKELGLLDEMGYLDQVQDVLQELAETEEYQSVSLGRYVQRMDREGGENRVALVFGEGAIVSASNNSSPFNQGSDTLYGPKVASAIRAAADDEDVKAILFRVNSPGGSAVGSDLVWREIERAQKKGKTVVVSMSSVAGSGGYWVAMGADAIVAQPSTITGSIGVVFGKMNIRGLFEMLGSNIDGISLSKNSDIMSPYASLSPEQKALMTASIGSLYDDFVRKVSEGRGKDFETIEKIARGRIWSGQDALDLGLIDALGGYDAALNIAAEKAGFDKDDVDLVIYPQPKDFFTQLMENNNLQASASSPLDPKVLEALALELSTPKVWAMMPNIQIR